MDYVVLNIVPDMGQEFIQVFENRDSNKETRFSTEEEFQSFAESESLILKREDNEKHRSHTSFANIVKSRLYETA